MSVVVISQPFLFPWPGFYEQLMLADTYIFLDDAQFSKGSFTNRIQLRHGVGRRWMTIPLKGTSAFQPIIDLEPANAGWREAHRDLLRRSLDGAPYLSHALAILETAYAHDNLCDVLIASVEEPARYMALNPGRHRARSSQLDVSGKSWQRVLDIVLRFEGTRYLTGHGAANYLNHEAFEARGVAVDYMRYSLTTWRQLTDPFTPYVSVLDLIANAGPDASRYLNPCTTPWRDFLAERGVERRCDA